jgi:uncharacterized RDD family membrane protein YckC
MRMLPEIHTYLIRGDDGQEYGPVDLNEMYSWVQENRAGLGTEVRIDEPDAPWRPWQDYPELIALLAQAHVTSPVPGLPGLVIAPMWRRVAAFGLDLILIMVLATPIFAILAVFFMPDWFVQYIAASYQPSFTPPEIPLFVKVWSNMTFNLVLTLYFAGFHLAHGQTPGKTLLRLRVVDSAGQKPSLAKSIIRALVLIISMNLLFLPLVYAFFNPSRRALHDFVADTYVIEA